MSDLPTDLPKVPENLDPDLRKLLVRLREAVQVGSGFRSGADDRWVRVRDLSDAVFRERASIGSGSGGSPVPGPPGPPGAPAPGTTPDPTPPPTPSGLVATALFSHIFIEWDPPIYSQGHGHGQTNIYGAVYSGTGPLPTFSNAELIGTAPGALTQYAHPSELGVQWHIWIKWQSRDGYESTSPAGGTNGVTATVGKIGDTDLVDEIIRARHLLNPLNGLYLNDDPVTRDASAWEWITGTPGAVIADASQPFGGSSLIGPATPTNSTVVHKRLIPIDITNTYRLRVKAAKSGDSDRRMYLFVAFYDANGALLTATSNPAGWPFGGTYHYFGLVNQVPPSTAYTEYEVSFGVGETRGIPAAARYMRIGSLVHYQEAGGGTTGRNYFAAVRLSQVMRAQDLAAASVVAGKLAAGALIAGDGVMGNLYVDDAKIANMSASKLSVGDGTVGGNLKSANYVSALAGWIVRPDGFAEFNNNVVVRGTIYAGAGTIGGALIGATSVQSSNYAGGVGGFGWRLNNDGTGQIGGFYVNTTDIRSYNYTAGPGGTGWIIRNDGTAEFQAAHIRGQLTTGQIAGDAVFTNVVSAPEELRVYTVSGGSVENQSVDLIQLPSASQSQTRFSVRVQGFLRITCLADLGGNVQGNYWVSVEGNAHLWYSGETQGVNLGPIRFKARPFVGPSELIEIPLVVSMDTPQLSINDTSDPVILRITMSHVRIRQPIAIGGATVPAISACWLFASSSIGEMKR